MQALLAFPFLFLGPLLVVGIFLQAKAIIMQTHSFLGVGLKMLSLIGLVGASVLVRHNIVPYLILFAVSLAFSLLIASLARRSLLS